jgi:hypothetical protein
MVLAKGGPFIAKKKKKSEIDFNSLIYRKKIMKIFLNFFLQIAKALK